MVRATTAALFAALVSTILPMPASASFHLVKIVEVFSGTTTQPAAQYVMLQMYFPGQNFVGGHSVSLFDAAGTSLATFTFTGSVANGANLATILIATPEAEAVFGIAPDLTMTPAVQPEGGAVCYEAIDCVSWGNFSAPSALPRAPGPPFNAPAGLVPDMAMHRTLSSGGTVTNFTFAPPAPRNNAGMTGMPGTGATPTPTPNPLPTGTPSTSICVGDCTNTKQVTVSEVITMVNIALDTADLSTCLAGDEDGDGTITITEIIAAVNNALNGCPI